LKDKATKDTDETKEPTKDEQDQNTGSSWGSPPTGLVRSACGVPAPTSSWEGPFSHGRRSERSRPASVPNG
jgi:hypothetical protein